MAELQALAFVGWYFTGLAVTAAALISPLCALSVALFSARVGQHMVLALLAAPLVAAGRPAEAFAAALRVGVGRWTARPGYATAMFAAVIWFWHAPGPYAATFESVSVYWCMHLSVFASALWLWSTLIDHGAGVLAPVLAGFISSVQMGLLGALITLAPRALYAPHALTTTAWGLTPLQDQQLGGSIMWVPGCVVFLAVAMCGLRRLLGQPRFAPVLARQ